MNSSQNKCPNGRRQLLKSPFSSTLAKNGMRSLFWRILGAFWLALILTGLLTFLLTRFLNQDTWVLARHPDFSGLAAHWVKLYEKGDSDKAQQMLQKLRQQKRIFTQVFDEEGSLLSSSVRMRNNAATPPGPDRLPGQHAGWRRLTQEVTTGQGQNFLFVYRIPQNELTKWRYGHSMGPFLLIAVALVVLTLISLLLTFSITRPLMRLRHAVHELGETAYQQQHLATLAQRKDELGVLAADFNRMGQRLQDMINSQRQLLRDVSHELRSPLARLQVGLALAERAPAEKQHELWPKLVLECGRLDALIDEILVLARMEQDSPQAERINLSALLQELREDCLLLAPGQQIDIDCPDALELWLAKAFLQRALDNLLRNALRFNPPGTAIEIRVLQTQEQLSIGIRDHGPGVSEDLLGQLTHPFIRAQGQQSEGYGLGLSITERAVRQLKGELVLANHPEGGFVASILLPVR